MQGGFPSSELSISLKPKFSSDSERHHSIKRRFKQIFKAHQLLTLFDNIGMFFVSFFFFSPLKFNLHLINIGCSWITSLLGVNTSEQTFVAR